MDPLNSVSSMNSQISQVQTMTQSQELSVEQNVESGEYSNQEDSVDLGSQEEEFSTYNSEGTMDKAEFNAQVVTQTLDRLNSNPFGSGASSDSYAFQKEVLSAYSKF